MNLLNYRKLERFLLFQGFSFLSKCFYVFMKCRTLTTPVELIKCLRSIKEHAFSSSPYPVIITFEDHLSPDLQAKVAKVFCHFLLGMLIPPVLISWNHKFLINASQHFFFLFIGGHPNFWKHVVLS